MAAERKGRALPALSAPVPCIFLVVYKGGALERDRASGFYELTAISHIGPALAYLAQIKANGDARWKARLASLQTHVAEVRALNARATDNWLDRLNQPAWSARKAQIRNMVDYACASTLNYIGSLGDGERFTAAGVNDDFFNGTSAQFPIPFVNVMIGTFMLEALRGAADVHDALARLKLDWPHAMVLVSSRAGSNVSSGLTEGPFALRHETRDSVASTVVLKSAVVPASGDPSSATVCGTSLPVSRSQGIFEGCCCRRARGRGSG